jgi:hypothetical protein
MRTIVFAGLLAGLTLSLGAVAADRPTSPSAPTPTSTDDTPPKPDEKKDEVTVWILEATGKG